MKNFIKKIIRKLYWKYAHNGDSWQHRLVIYHMNKLIRDCEKCNGTSAPTGRFILSQIEEKINDPEERRILPRVFMNPIADVTIESLESLPKKEENES